MPWCWASKGEWRLLPQALEPIGWPPPSHSQRLPLPKQRRASACARGLPRLLPLTSLQLLCGARASSQGGRPAGTGEKQPFQFGKPNTGSPAAILLDFLHLGVPTHLGEEEWAASEKAFSGKHLEFRKGEKKAFKVWTSQSPWTPPKQTLFHLLLFFLPRPRGSLTSFTNRF